MSPSVTPYLTYLVEGLQGQYGTVGLYAAVQRLFVGFGFVGGPGSCLVDAPFGKFGTWKRFAVHGDIGWMLMEIVSPVAFLYGLSLPLNTSSSSFLSFSPFRIASAFRALPFARQVLAGCYLVHYANRSVVSSIRNPGRARMNIIIPLLSALFNLANGGTIGVWIAGGIPQTGKAMANAGMREAGWAKPLFLLGAVMWAGGLCSNIHHDEILYNIKRSKQAKEKEGKGKESSSSKDRYSIPQGGLYRFVSHPSYSSEWFEWLGFLLATLALAPAPFPPTPISSFFPSLSLKALPNPLKPLKGWYLQPPALFLWQEIGAMLPRARSGHAWYRKTFGKEWEEKGAKWVVVPGVY
ncbi:3-oxo-5-alpha-steroid 4-dehydrogenase 1 [Rhodotorula toruloides]|uniref:3-oxo-5-alpha-steroid 4-dehydrogenase 1 n=1 Tax=Rhodotorula toruloides TaxID=5286 RepID=A0A511KPD7_RHOTO|nr:3-oxo-5-alpha-steroid 4-dehydrogenase 1 [Rhodotorula toruloides]